MAKGLVRWAYRLEPLDGRTRLTESWEFTSAGQEHFVSTFGDDAPKMIEKATRAAHDGIPATLEAIKRIAEKAEETSSVDKAPTSTV